MSTAHEESVDLITLQQCCHRIPGQTRTVESIRNWITYGLRGHRLPSRKIAGRVLVSVQDFEEFLRVTAG